MGLAEAYFITAANLDHDNPVYRRNSCRRFAWRIPRTGGAEAAARDLERMLTDPRVSLFAARALLADAIRGQGQRPRATVRPKARFPSRPRFQRRPSAASRQRSPEHGIFIRTSTKSRTALRRMPCGRSRPGDWLNAHGMAAETLRWFARLPPATQSNIRVQMTAAERVYLHVRLAWPQGLSCQVQLGATCEFLRSAMLIRCDREQLAAVGERMETTRDGSRGEFRRTTSSLRNW